MDAFALLLFMLEQKEVLSGNEVSWILNSHKISPTQAKILNGDAEDRRVILAGMRTNSWEESQAENLKQYGCLKCKVFGKIVPLVAEIQGQNVQISGGFHCGACNEHLFVHQLVVKKEEKV